MLNWLDVAEGAQSGFEDWHNREHVRERLAVPGFCEGRRYRTIDAAPREGRSWLIAYDVESLAALCSPAYSASLNNPTAATRAVVPTFRRVLRTAYEVIAQFGEGLGGFLRTIRLPPAERPDDVVGPWLAALRDAADEPGMTRVRLGRPDAAVTHFKDETAEGRATDRARGLRHPWCVVLESSGVEGLDGATARLRRRRDEVGVDILDDCEQDSFRLAFALQRRIDPELRMTQEESR